MTRVALLWHMHQPFYQDLVTGEHILPWVRLHALKDYYGMAALTREFPELRVTFNLVPSLLVQLEAFAADRANDRSLTLGLKPAAHLTPEERTFIVTEFFHAQRERMIEPSPRYAELLRKREETSGDPAAAARAFSETDLRDLQVWHKLVWIDPLYHDGDPRIHRLVERGRGYVEEDKQALREVELEILRAVVPEYSEGMAAGRLELSTSPFYHPILPLLCDTDVHARAHPHLPAPRQRFRHPEDAAEQLRRAVEYHARTFGAPPRGVWPSEGSVSDAVVPLAQAAGFTWMATDELILARSLGQVLTRDANGHLQQPEVLYRPYLVRAGDGVVACLFRDHVLSDLIGFTYAGWPAGAAAADFVARLAEGGRRYADRTGGQDAVIPVILDGENAWEHFEGGGRPFLRALYGALTSHPEIQTVTMSEACADTSAVLNGIVPGSWINGDFYIWIGHRDDHRAWGQLAEARQALGSPGPGADEAALARAREEILIAEGSDWFWWYGDDHSSAHDLEFDDLFRRHLRNAYRALDKAVPEELFLTNITTEPPRAAAEPPTGFVRVALDGDVTSYFEWLGAGSVDLRAVSGSMHQMAETGSGVTRLLLFGFDLERLFVRADFARRAADLLNDGLELQVQFISPADTRVRAHASGGALLVELEERQGGVWRARAEQAGPQGACGEILEVAIPLALLGGAPETPVSFFVALLRGGAEVERHPTHRPVELTIPAANFEELNWKA